MGNFLVQNEQGVRGNFFKDIHGGLVGWIFLKNQSFSLRKSICTTDRFVVLIFSQLFFLAGKNKASKYKIASK